MNTVLLQRANGSRVRQVLAPLSFLLILGLFLSTQTPNFLTVDNLRTVAIQTVAVAILAIGVIGIVATAAYILWRIIQSVFLGEYDPHKIDHWTDLKDGQDKHEPSDMVRFEKLTMWPLVILIVILGIFPVPLLHFFNQAAVELVSRL